MKPTGGGPQVVPVPPPNSLFPGITGGVNAAGGSLGSTLATGLSSAASGLDVNKIFSSVVAANQQFTQQGQSAITEQFAAQGATGGSDLMSALTNYREQSQLQLQSQLGQMSFQGEALKEAGLNSLESLATSFAPSAVVTQQPAGNSIFSQVASAGSSAAMLYLLAGM